MRRIVCTYLMKDLPAPPAEVFPLLCPVREADWIPGWSAELLWSRSGLAEDGALFTTPNGWLWHIVCHEPASGRIRFSVTAPGSHLLDLALHVEERRLTWSYTLHALSPEGETFLRDYDAGFAAKMALLERRLRHWLRNGTMLPEGAA